MKARTIWFCGLPCSGKTTLGDGLAACLRPLYGPVLRLDADHVRNGLSAGLGWSPDGRTENIRRNACVAQLANEQGIHCVASFITPLHYHQEMVTDIVENATLVYVNTPPHVCEERDVKGMWKKARKGLIHGFTGYDDGFEVPEKGKVVDGTLELYECVKELFEMVEKL